MGNKSALCCNGSTPLVLRRYGAGGWHEPMLLAFTLWMSWQVDDSFLYMAVWLNTDVLDSRKGFDSLYCLGNLKREQRFSPHVWVFRSPLYLSLPILSQTRVISIAEDKNNKFDLSLFLFFSHYPLEFYLFSISKPLKKTLTPLHIFTTLGWLWVFLWTSLVESTVQNSHNSHCFHEISGIPESLSIQKYHSLAFSSIPSFTSQVKPGDT